MYGVALVARRLSKYRPITFTGAQSTSSRASSIQQFVANPEHKALVLSTRAGGFGLNLQVASYVFHLDRWWNPAVEEQADSRAHRMGQLYPVTVFRYICAGTIEERIERILAEKRRLFHEVVDDISIALSGALTEKELFGLFGMDAPV